MDPSRGNRATGRMAGLRHGSRSVAIVVLCVACGDLAGDGLVVGSPEVSQAPAAGARQEPEGRGAAPVIVPPPLRAELLVNEPTTYEPLTSQPWNRLETLGWGHLDRSAWSVITSDPTAPFSPARVLEQRFPTGFEGGSEPAVDWYSVDGRRLYISMGFKTSDVWTGHPSGVNKIWFLRKTRGNFDLQFTPTESGEWRLRVAPQSPDFPDWTFLDENVEPQTFRSGEWMHVETQIEHVASTRWSVRWWINGVLAADHPNVSHGDQDLTEFQIAPTWGGTGSFKPTDEYFRFDHVYLSR